MNVFYKINADDNVATAIIMDEDPMGLPCDHGCQTPKNLFLKPGTPYPLFEEGKGEIGTLTPNTKVPANFKVAVTPIPKDSSIIKFNAPIGFSSCDIPKGDVVHVCNIILEHEGVKTILAPFASDKKNNIAIAKKKTIPVGQSIKLKHIHVIDSQIHQQMNNVLDEDTHLGTSCSIIPAGAPIRIGNMIDTKKIVLENDENINDRNKQMRKVIFEFYRFLNNDLSLKDLKW